MRCTWGILQPCLARTIVGDCSLLGPFSTWVRNQKFLNKVKGKPERKGKKEKRSLKDTKKIQDSEARSPH